MKWNLVLIKNSSMPPLAPKINCKQVCRIFSSFIVDQWIQMRRVTILNKEWNESLVYWGRNRSRIWEVSIMMLYYSYRKRVDKQSQQR